ncbi:hypothetical protein PsYK624_065300 [Phanerochaete sordida]|uniref:Uncharacterized protein n=1 Tax=Phanerochaete sordida TaxID=48140 RepID=A0A9P3LDA9_9APHY|nr:hypothetical protein PsYK624_065300 [Phanerochaete sordida]
MPSSRRARPQKDFQEKDNHITDLEWRLEAQASKSTLLQERLTATLDAMDTLQLEHERELSAERREKERAREKLHRFIEYASTIERERDECKEALLTVVEKESAPLGEGPDKPESRALEASAKLILASLRSDLEKERVSHASTHRHAEVEILSLRAQLARREAELEACTLHQDHGALLASAVHSGAEQILTHTGEDAPPSAPALSPEAAVEILELRVAKNKELEGEIRNLSDKLHDLRQESEPQPAPKAGAGRVTRNPLKSPDLRPCSPDDVLSPYTMTPRHPSTPHAGKSTSHLRLAQVAAAPPSPPQTRQTELQLFQEQMQLLADGIERLEEERRLVKETVGDQSLDSAVVSSPPTTLHYTEEETSSQNTAVHGAPSPPQTHDPDVAALRAELEQMRFKAAQRETELLEEIMRLQEALSSVPQPPSQVVGDLLDDNAAELSMELGTPLAPVAVLWGSEDGGTVTVANQVPGASGPVVHDAYIEVPGKGTEKLGIAAPDKELVSDLTDDDDLPSRIPLPPSPDPSEEAPVRPRSGSLRGRPPTPYASPNASLLDGGDAEEDATQGQNMDTPSPTQSPNEPRPPQHTSDCTCAERLDVLERELEETKQAVSQRDEELVELRRQVHELRVAALGR